LPTEIQIASFFGTLTDAWIMMHKARYSGENTYPQASNYELQQIKSVLGRLVADKCLEKTPADITFRCFMPSQCASRDFFAFISETHS
jgi:hypothetical protein